MRYPEDRRFLITWILIFLFLLFVTKTSFAAEPFGQILQNHIASYFSQEEGQWVSLGDCRVTEYCPSCNSPAGHGSASGVYLQEGHVACGWLPLGTRIRIDGVEYEVVDVCGTDAIDIFVDTEYCQCSRNSYSPVEQWKEL